MTEAVSTRPTGFIGRNILWLFVSQVLTWMITLIVLILAPDRLGADDFGALNFSIAFVSFFTFVGILGTGQLITRTVARDPDLMTSYVVNGLVMKVLMAIVLSALAIGMGVAFGYDGTSLALIGIALAGMTLSLLNDVLYGGLVAVNRVARPAMWWVVQTYIAAALAIVVLFTTQNVVAFAAASAVALILPVVTNAAILRPFITGPRHIDFALWGTMARRGAPLLVLAGLILIYGTIDVPLLEAMTDNVTVAHYTLAYRWVTVPIFVATAVINASASSLAAFAIEDESQFVSLSNRSLRLVLAISLPTATGLFLVAFNLMDILYEPEFADSAVIMRILAVHIPLAAISTVLGAVLIASDRQGPYAAFALVAAIANPLLSILFIRWTITWWENGAIGAAIITVGTEFFMVYAAYRLRRRGVLDRATTMYALRCLVACGIMAVPLVAFDGWNMFLKIGVGIVVYGAAAIALRVITLGEILEVPRKVLHARRYTPDAAPPPADDDAGTAEAEPLDGR